MLVMTSLKSKITELDARLKSMQPMVLNLVSQVWGRPLSLHSFHGHIGGRNNTYTDTVRGQYLSKDDFIAGWIHGLLKNITGHELIQQQKYSGTIFQNTPHHHLVKCLQQPDIKKYIFYFLERNYYKKFEERIRSKPNDNLWGLWFGENNLMWGLFIAPIFRNGEWVNDKSEIRKVDFEYWTIGHLIKTGLIIPNEAEPYTFRDVSEIITFYNVFLKRLSRSNYEKKIIDLYISYLLKSKHPYSEPLLIPELRINTKKAHKYRVDFTILNPFMMKFIGFELSPSSSHNSVKNIKTKLQKHVNEELKAIWIKEMEKRNSYFSEFGIQIITYTDEKLQKIDDCFLQMQNFLSEKPLQRNINNELVKVMGLKF
jgi:hypothetical protein